MKKLTLAMSLGASAFLLAAAPAAAAVNVFANRTAFNAAAGSTTTTDFSSFLADTSFRGTPVDAGPFSVETTGPTTSYSSYNFVDVPPLASSETNVNGSADLRVFTAAGSSFFIKLNAPSTAFAADFQSINDDAFRTALFLDGVEVAGPIVSGSGFFGLTSSTPFSTIEFRGKINDVFGVDNVTVNSAVPEPATWAMMLLGFGAMGVSMRRRRRTQNRPQVA